MDRWSLNRTLGIPARNRWVLLGVAGLGIFVCGCSAFNPSFVSLFDPTGTSSAGTVPNAPGHVVVAVSNQTVLDDRLRNYLLPQLNLSEAEAQALRPRIRMRVRITYIDGSFLTIEFIDGSPNLIDPDFDAQAFADLNQNDLNNSVALCDVASVQLEPGTSVEVFLPVEILEFQLVETSGPGGEINTTFELRSSIQPQFWPLEVDQVDEDNNVTLQQNIGARDVPSPTPNVICGSIVVFTVSGTLTVPFLDEVRPNDPSYDLDDAATEATIGGRYEFIVTVQ